jgi:hypothetical protein
LQFRTSRAAPGASQGVPPPPRVSPCGAVRATLPHCARPCYECPESEVMEHLASIVLPLQKDVAKAASNAAVRARTSVERECDAWNRLSEHTAHSCWRMLISLPNGSRT